MEVYVVGVDQVSSVVQGRVETTRYGTRLCYGGSSGVAVSNVGVNMTFR